MFRCIISITRLAGEKIMIGGFALNTLKKLKGDKFGFPWVLIVLAKAIGLGATALNSNSYVMFLYRKGFRFKRYH